MGNVFGNSLNNELNYTYSNHEEDDEFFEISINDSINNKSLQENKEEESVACILARIDRECNLLIHKWKAEQIFLKSRMSFLEDTQFMQKVKLVGGVDISFSTDKNDLIHAVVCLVVLSYPDLQVQFQRCEIVHLTSLYVPGFLAFREVDHIQKLCIELFEEQHELYPDVILVDGNGILHHTKFGLASHLGVVLNLPTIGVAKKLFHVDGLEKNEKLKKLFQNNLLQKGDTHDLIGSSNFLYGKALRSTDHSSNPIFVSVGNKISLDSAVRLVNNCCQYRVPEPVRLADQYSRSFIQLNYDEHVKECSDSYAALNSRFKNLSTKVESIKAENVN